MLEEVEKASVARMQATIQRGKAASLASLQGLTTCPIRKAVDTERRRLGHFTPRPGRTARAGPTWLPRHSGRMGPTCLLLRHFDLTDSTRGLRHTT